MQECLDFDHKHGLHLLGLCLSYFSVAEIKYPHKSNLRKEGRVGFASQRKLGMLLGHREVKATGASSNWSHLSTVRKRQEMGVGSQLTLCFYADQDLSTGKGATHSG